MALVELVRTGLLSSACRSFYDFRMMRLLWVGVAVSAFAGGCTSGYTWRPHKLAYERPGQQLTTSTLLVYDGDLDALIAANAVLMGSLRASDAKTAREQAARYGGTHVLLIADRSFNDKLWTRCDTYANTTWCSDATRQVRVLDYAVIRIPSEHWHLLPPLLDPRQSERGDLSCHALPMPPRGCQYSHDDVWAGQKRHHEKRLFLQCADEPYPREVTELLASATCAH